MDDRVSCPVFSCPGTSARPCAGYRGSCDRHYCTTHTAGEFCERCSRRQMEDRQAEYRELIASLSRRSLSASLTWGVITLFLASILLFVLSVLHPGQRSFGGLNVVALCAGMAGVVIALVWYGMKAREYMRAESLELEMRHRGFAEFYRQWQDKLDSIE